MYDKKKHYLPYLRQKDKIIINRHSLRNTAQNNKNTIILQPKNTTNTTEPIMDAALKNKMYACIPLE
jgi:hypothetical protein